MDNDALGRSCHHHNHNHRYLNAHYLVIDSTRYLMYIYNLSYRLQSIVYWHESDNNVVLIRVVGLVKRCVFLPVGVLVEYPRPPLLCTCSFLVWLIDCSAATL